MLIMFATKANSPKWFLKKIDGLEGLKIEFIVKIRFLRFISIFGPSRPSIFIKKHFGESPSVAKMINIKWFTRFYYFIIFSQKKIFTIFFIYFCPSRSSIFLRKHFGEPPSLEKIISIKFCIRLKISLKITRPRNWFFQIFDP